MLTRAILWLAAAALVVVAVFLMLGVLFVVVGILAGKSDGAWLLMGGVFLGAIPGVMNLLAHAAYAALAKQ